MLTGLHHVGYVVPDLDAAIAFYRDVLGMHLQRRGDAGPGFNFEVAVFRLGDGSTGIELMRPTTGTGPFADFLRANPKGALYHVAYAVEGHLTDALNHAQAADVPAAVRDDDADWLLALERKHPEEIAAPTALDRPLQPVSQRSPMDIAPAQAKEADDLRGHLFGHRARDDQQVGLAG